MELQSLLKTSEPHSTFHSNSLKSKNLKRLQTNQNASEISQDKHIKQNHFVIAEQN